MNGVYGVFGSTAIIPQVALLYQNTVYPDRLRIIASADPGLSRMELLQSST